MHIVTVCGMGFGTSLMLLMDIQEIAKKNGYSVTGQAADIGSASTVPGDCYVASRDLAKKILTEKLIISIDNILNKSEIEEKIMPHIITFFEKESKHGQHN